MKSYQEIKNQITSELSERDLVESIKYYNKKYRDGESEIEDYEYDDLIEILRTINPNSELFTSSIVEDIENSSRKELHKIEMFSLEKEKSISEIIKWIQNSNINSIDEELIISPKLDGISLSNEEQIQHVLTRGSGIYGQISDIHYKATPNYKQDCSNNNFITFGEAIISKKNWNDYFVGKLNPRTNKPFKSSRNTVAGLFNNDDAVDELKYIDYIRYGLVDSNNQYLDKKEQLTKLNSLNNVYFNYDVIKIKDFIDLYQQNKLEDYLNSLYKDWSNDYQIDGLVIEFNSSFVRNKLGREKNNNPKFARAIKLPNWFDIYITNVIEESLKVSKNGKVKPVFYINPVTINGATINKATAYNCKYLLNNNIAVGSEIEIVRSGDVIPKHIKTINHNQDNVNNLKNKLKTCPSCGEKLIWDETNTELICTNIKNCKDIKLSKLVHFITTLKIEEFGEKEIENLYNLGFDGYSKLINITHNDLIKINGWGDKSIKKLLKQFKSLSENEVELSLLLHSLDLFDGKIGYKLCKLILENFDVNEIVNNLNNELKLQQIVNNLTNIKGVQVITATSFVNGIKEFFNSKHNKLPIKYSFEQAKQVISGDKFKDFKVCFTGVRDKELERIIQENQGSIVGSVSSKTSHLVVKDYSDKTLSSDKATKANDLNIQIYSLEDFKEKFL